MFVRSDRVRDKGRLEGLLHPDHVAVVSVARVRHVVVGVEPLDPVMPTPGDHGDPGQLSVGVVGDPRGVGGVGVVASVQTGVEAWPAKVDHSTVIQTAIGGAHPGVVSEWKMVSGVQTARPQPVSPLCKP